MVVVLLCQLFLLLLAIRADSDFQPAGFYSWFWQNLTQTIAIDLSQSWTNLSIPAVFINTSSVLPSSRRPNLWYNPIANLVYSFGGEPYNKSDIDNPTVWAFSPNGNGGASWHKKTSSEDNLWNLITPTFGALTTISSDTFYSLGGFIPTAGSEFPGTSNDNAPGMVKFEFETNVWTNLSSAGYGAAGTGVFGQAEYIATFGKKGIIVFLGGETPTASYSYATGSSLTDMSVITIYDIDNAKWLTQKTTGNTPARRYAFCIAGVSEADSKSYELFIFGGLSSTQDKQPITASFTDVYLLSIPSFSWTKLNDSTTQMRGSHQCEVIGNRQMLVIGGHNPSNSILGNLMDSFRSGLGIFDMSNLSWSNQYNHQAPEYVRPGLINDYYAQSTQSPTWSSPEVQSLFETSVTQTQPPSSPTAAPTPVSTRHHKAISAIVGAVIGGVFALSSLVLLGSWLMKHRRRETDITDNQVQNTEHDVHLSPTPELEQTQWELGDRFQPQYTHSEMEATHDNPNRNFQPSELYGYPSQ